MSIDVTELITHVIVEKGIDTLLTEISDAI
jgi:hypothetical protein